MTRQEIIQLQEHVGTEPDGFWGPLSTAACQKHLRRMMPKPPAFPSQRDVSRGNSVYGPHGTPNGSSPPTKKIRLPFALHLYGDAAKKVTTLSPHARCADSLLAVFRRLGDVYPDTESRKASGILNYYGLYNPRSMRGGTAWSMHAWAIAIDLDAPRNKNASHWPVRSKMPIEVMECFAKEGWMPAGAFWSRDAMHFQATK